MKAVILAGGLGTRISEETSLRPKPMIEIGGKPILWHIMKMYSAYGINDFVICCGYKGYVIKEFFANYFLHSSDVTFDFKKNNTLIHEERSEPWSVTLVDTGDDSMTGGRLKRVQKYLDGEGTFCLTYGDGLSDINISKTIEFHKSHGRVASLLAVNPPARFGALNIENDLVTSFKEKPKGQEALVSGGFFVLSKAVFDYLKDDRTVWEHEPLMKLASEGNLKAYCHDGFWHPMDTLRDKTYLEDLWSSGKAPWKVWL
jgi:glucose-1-phosphate cytidylyltransferase